MSRKDSILQRLAAQIVSLNGDGAKASIEEALAAGVAARDIVSEGLAPAMETVGTRFEQGEYFLPELLLGARATQTALAILKPHLAAAEQGASGRVLIGTVEGDVHDIGKNIVAAVLEGEGFEVHDLGEDVPAAEFLRKAREVEPDVVAISALISLAVSKISETISLLRSNGVAAKIIVGGAALTADSAVAVGADAYGKDAWEGARRLRALVEGGR